MAASTSHSIVASPVPNHGSHDVFLSFRGEDTRNAFTDHLHDALDRAGIRPFRDENDIKRGEELEPEIKRAIMESRASIVVLSKNYAASTWCLDELHLILERRRECDHFVLPVFYHVDPTDVGTHQNSFEIQVQDSGRWTRNNVNLWKAALTEVTSLAGLVLEGHETKFLKEIVDTIYKELDPKPVKLPSNLTGMDTRYNDIRSWLEQSDAQFLIICGMGGSGKTTLAKYILYSNWQKFENISFLEDIGSRCKEHHDLLNLQEKLLQDILGGKKRKIPSVSHGTCKIEKALQTKRSLIVLDDIDEQWKLEELLGTGRINKESKIIITTEVLNAKWWFESNDWSCKSYEMKTLNDDESLELLSRHAFRSKSPMEGFEQLALKALKYCGGNPLALIVLGSDLCVSEEDTAKKSSIPVWESKFRLLEKEMYPKVRDILRRSYNSLPHNDRELFLHIACFFVGQDMDYVAKILEPDYHALSRIKTLTDRCLLSVSPENKLMMHPLLQELGRTIVHQESPKDPAKRSRVWRNRESYNMLKKGKGSETMEGLALDMNMLDEEEYIYKPKDLRTDSLNEMDNLKLLQLKWVHLTGSYENFSEQLKWLCWPRCNLWKIPSNLFMGNVVAIDMSNSNLVVFEPPMVLKSLQVLDLTGSHVLSEIRNISRLPKLKDLILGNCQQLTHVCETIGSLESLVLLDMTGCERICSSLLEGLSASTGGGSTERPPFSFPHSLERLFLKDCKLECTDYFPLSFDVQLFLKHLNLANSPFESLPNYNHLTNLRVLDLSLCSRLKWLLCLPSTLAELYTYHCASLEKITFESQQFTLQEFGYEGCINLLEVQGFFKLKPLAILNETDLGHMMWLKEYQNHEMCLAGDDQLTIGRSRRIQMLYEFKIMSTSLLDIKDRNMTPEYRSESPSLSFDVPLCPTNRRLKGLNVSFKYTISGEHWAWFAKISVTNGVDLMYTPIVFGKPAWDEVAIWLSYWPIGNALNVGDKVDVSIAVISGLEVCECGASLVYDDDEVTKEALENKMGWVECLGGDLSSFQLSTGAYYLCRHDFFELMEVGRLTGDWFSILVGDTIDCTEVRGWRKTGRPKQLHRSFIELKTIRCIFNGPELDQIYMIPKRSKLSSVNEIVELKPNIDRHDAATKRKLVLSANLDGQTQKDMVTKAINAFEGIDLVEADFKNGRLTIIGDVGIIKVVSSLRIFDKMVHYLEFTETPQAEISDATTKVDVHNISEAPVVDDGLENTSKEIMESERAKERMVLSVNFDSQTQKDRVMKAVNEYEDIDSVTADFKNGKLTIIGDFDYGELVSHLSNFDDTIKILQLAKVCEHEISDATTENKIVLGVNFDSQTKMDKAMEAAYAFTGIHSIVTDFRNGRQTIIGDFEITKMVSFLRFRDETIQILEFSKIRELEIGNVPTEVDMLMEMSVASILTDVEQVMCTTSTSNDVEGVMSVASTSNNVQQAESIIGNSELELVVSVSFDSQTEKNTMIKAATVFTRAHSVAVDFKNGKLTIIGSFNHHTRVIRLLSPIDKTIQILEIEHCEYIFRQRRTQMNINFDSKIPLAKLEYVALDVFREIHSFVVDFKDEKLTIIGILHQIPKPDSFRDVMQILELAKLPERNVSYVTAEKKIVLKLEFPIAWDVMKAAYAFEDTRSIVADIKSRKLTVIGCFDYGELVSHLRKIMKKIKILEIEPAETPIPKMHLLALQARSSCSVM